MPFRPSIHLSMCFVASILLAWAAVPLTASAGQAAYVADPDSHRILEVNLDTGDRAVVSGALYRLGLKELEFDPLGNRFFLMNKSPSGEINTVLSMDASGNAVARVSGYGTGSGPTPTSASALVMESGGTLAAIADHQGSAESKRALYRIDPDTGDRTLLLDLSSSSTLYLVPGSLAATPDGNLLILLYDATDYPGAYQLARFNPATGDLTTLSCPTCDPAVGSGPAFEDGPIARFSDGTVAMAFHQNPDGTGVLRIDPSTGDRTWIYSPAQTPPAFQFGAISDLAIDATGSILALDSTNQAVVRIEPASGVSTVISRSDSSFPVGTGPSIGGVGRLTVASDGSIILAAGSGLLRVDPATGNRSVFGNFPVRGSGPELAANTLLQDHHGNLIVAVGNAVYSIDRVTGDRVELSGPTQGSGPAFSSVDKVLAVDADGRILVHAGSLGIVAINSHNGNRTVVSNQSVGTGPSLSDPVAMVVEASGSYAVAQGGYVVNPSIYPGSPYVDGPRNIIRIDPTTGNRADISGVLFNASVADMVVEPSGTYVVGNIQLYSYFIMIPWTFGETALHRIDPAAATKTILSKDGVAGSGPYLGMISGIAREDEGDLLVACAEMGYYGSGRLLRVDPHTGDREAVSTGTLGMGEPLPTVGFDIALAPAALTERPGTITVPPGDTPPIPVNPLGLLFDFLSNAFQGDVTVTPHFGFPPNLPNALPRYWEIDGLAGGSFLVTIRFPFFREEVLRAGLLPNTLEIYKSDDGGQTWTRVDTALDTLAGTATTTNPQSSFSLWAISGQVNGVTDWIYFE